MDHNRFDVIVVGGGPAGITAATALGKQGFSVLVCEAAVYPGAENWSGAVYFAESLEADEAFGKQAIEEAPFERRLIERGFFLYNGHSMLGGVLRDPGVFRSCYTVLRPVFDRYLAELSREHGVVLMCETTVQSLIRHDGRVIGVHTERGPAYADVVFLAEGDAAHLVTQEGYERVGPDAGGKPTAESGPHFLQGVKEVVSLPAEVIEERFGLPEGGGGAYEMLLRNGSRHGRTVRLNMGGFIYTNRDSLSLGFVLPVDNLARNFDGDHNLLMEWFKGLPEVARWIEGGEVTSYGTKIIRGGGLREIPRLVDDGLVIGGAASGIGLDFPYPNFTGPATSMGLLFARAVSSIAADHDGPGNGAVAGGIGKSPFTAAVLEAAYVKPLKATHYYRNVERLADWPDYIERTRFFFERQLDVVNGAAFIMSRPNVAAPRRWWEVVRLKRRLIGIKRIGSVFRDLRANSEALGLGRAAWAGIGVGTVVRWLLNTVTALLPLGNASIGGDETTGIAEASTVSGGRFRMTYRVMAGAEPAGRMPWLARWYWKRFGPALAGAFADVYANDDEPLDDKLPRALGRLIGQISIWDPLVALFMLAVGSLIAAAQAAAEWFQYAVLKKDLAAFREQYVARLLDENWSRMRLDDDVVEIKTPYEHKLGTIRYRAGKHSHIKVMWPDELTARGELAESPLWSVCPAKVYEVQRHPMGMPGVVVNFDNCLKCETCWRATPDVHWSRATQQRLIYETYTPAHAELRDYLMARPQPLPRLRQLPSYWDAFWGDVVGVEDADAGAVEALRAELARFAATLGGYSRALADSPLVLEQGERRYLDDLLGVAARRFAAAHLIWASDALAGIRSATGESGASLWSDAAAGVEEMSRHARAKRFFWADVLGKQLLDHHLAGFANLFARRGELERTSETGSQPTAELGSLSAIAARAWADDWIQAENLPAQFDAVRTGIREWCDAHIDSAVLRSLEQQEPLSVELKAWLANQLAAAAEDGRRRATASGPTAEYGRRDVLLEELAAVDPSLAALAAQHLLAVDLLQGIETDEDIADRIRAGRSLATVVMQGSISTRPLATPAVQGVEGVEGEVGPGGAELRGEAPLVLAALAEWLLVVRDNVGYLVPIDDPRVHLDAVGCIGLVGAGVRRAVFDGCEVPAGRIFEIAALAPGSVFTSPAVDVPFADTLVVAVLDHLAIVRGAGAYLTGRARQQAASRVQFPGAFQDEAGRDTIAKFGAVKQMLAEMESQRILVEALSLLDPGPPDDVWLGAAVRKILAADAFGPQPGSLSYNAGQVFGGTAFSEDDCLAKYYRDSSPFRFLIAHDDALRAEIGRRRLDAVSAGDSLIPVSPQEAAWLDTLRDEGPLSGIIPRWEAACAEIEAWAVDAASQVDGGSELAQVVRFHAGSIVARALGIKACILRAAWRLECGLAAMATLEATALMADRFVADAPGLVGEAGLLGEVVAVGIDAIARGDFEPAAEIPDAEPYDEVLSTDHAAQSGEWLYRPFDRETLRYLPETLWNDPELRPFREQVEAEHRKRYVETRFDGLTYNRHLEKLHIVPDDDLRYLVDRGFMRMPIPSEYGGEGALKAKYYIVCEMSGRYGDAALSLAIMANTSIGTTPVLLGMKQDLPRARVELEKVKEDPALLGEISDGLDALIAGLERPDLERLQRDYLQLTDLVKARIVKSSVLKYIGGGFLRAYFAAGNAGKQRDLVRFEKELRSARSLIGEMLGAVEDRLVEYPRRERAHELFLKMISAGYISAFALTEPTAGSDSGGVKTSARLARRRVREDDDGVLYFFLDEEGESERRNLLDADRVEFDFDGHRMLYRWSEEAAPSEIRHDAYDYEKDLPGHWRTYEHAGREVAFTDIAQIRADADGKRWYEFWELNGAKMWITNGRFAHCFALYANTEPEGVTGFMVDRHAEGLVVGSDEEKLGQRGSPTNELSLTAVRVPRECIIGFRGRGQVNALETLNTGRAGLAVTTRATIQEMMEDAADYLGGGSEIDKSRGGIYPAQQTPVTPLQRYWMGRLMEELVTTAAVANELIGLFDHPLTKDVRMESAIGKYYGSEAEHEGIDWMERLRGLDGLTHRHRIEKTRRDARVLNIYEGTNEVQRYLLLRDLAQRVLPAWKAAGDDPLVSDDLGGAYPELRQQIEDAKRSLMSRLDEAVDALGNVIWENVNLQPCFFRLAEIAGLIKVMDAVLYRLEWLASHDVPDEYGDRLAKASLLVLARCALRIETLDRRFTVSYAYLQDDRYPPEVQLGFLSLDPNGAEAESWGVLPVSLRPTAPRATLSRSVRIIVLAKPVPVVAPRPRFGPDTLEESLYTIDAVDRLSLQMALELKRRDPARVTVEVISLAGAAGAEALRLALALGVDEATLLETPGDVALHDPTAVARLVARAMSANPADIVFAGAGASDTGQGIVAPMLAGILGRDHVDGVLAVDWGEGADPSLRLTASGWQGHELDVALPCVVAVEPTAEHVELEYRLGDAIAASSAEISRVEVDDAEPMLVRHRARPARGGRDAGRIATTPEAAAEVLLDIAGLSTSAGTSEVTPFHGDPRGFGQQPDDAADACLFVCEPAVGDEISAASSAALGSAARFAAGTDLALDIVLPLTGRQHTAGAVGQVISEVSPRRVYVIEHPRLAEFGWRGHLEWLHEFWGMYRGEPQWLLGPEAMNTLFARFAGQGPPGVSRCWPWFNVQTVRNGSGPLRLGSDIYDGAGQATAVPPRRGGLRIATFAPAAEIELPDKGVRNDIETEVFRYQPAVDYDPAADPIAALVNRLGGGELTLRDAEYIVDFGYGAGGREGLDSLAEPLLALLADELGLSESLIGGTRKVTQDLEVLPMNRQIGQTGVRVGPKVLMALAVSGAPQHVDWIDDNAVILSFNIDPEAPLMKLNEQQARPVVHPIVGDVHDTVPRFMAALRKKIGGEG